MFIKVLLSVLGILAILGLLVLAPNILTALQAESVSAVAAAIAAIFGAITAVAALMAARESSSSARDSARAVALAQKPVVRIAMKNGSEDNQGWMSVEIENLSQHPVRKGLLRWTLRDGTHGVADVPLIEGRTSPFGGMIHDAERVMTFPIGAFDDTLGGTDRVSFEFSGLSDIIRWKLSKETTYRIEEGSTVHQRNGTYVPVPQRMGVDQSEVEV